MDNTDNSLMAAHCSGDSTAFAELVRRYGDAVLGYLVRMTANREQAEDLFQETFRKVHEKAHTFAGNSFKSWLFTIATRVAIDHMRKRKRQPTVSLNQPLGCANGNCPDIASVTAADECSDPSNEVIRAEQKQQVRAAIQELPAKQRATLILAYYQQLSYSQVARTMGCSTGTVKMQMSRALRTLAGKLPEFDGIRS